MTITEAPSLTQVRTGFWHLQVIPELVDKLSANQTGPSWPFSHLLMDNREIQSSKATSVHRAMLVNNDQTTPVFVKHFHFRSPLDHLKHLVRKSRAMRAVEGDRLLRNNGFNAPKTLVIGWRRHWGKRTGYFTIATALEGYQNLYETVETVNQSDFSEKQRFIKSLATTVADLHLAKISHGDMRAGNVFCHKDDETGDWQFAFIDNERTRHHRRLPESLRIKNLVQLNLLSSPALETEDRLLFYEIYGARCFDTANEALKQKVIKKTHKRQAKKLAKTGQAR